MSVIVACLAVAAAEWRDNVDYYINTDDDAPLGRCDNTCSWSKDGVCDDARVKGPCALGTDCQDQCGNQPVRQAGLEVLFIILAASMQRESAWRPRTRRLRLIHPNV